MDWNSDAKSNILSKATNIAHSTFLGRAVMEHLPSTGEACSTLSRTDIHTDLPSVPRKATEPAGDVSVVHSTADPAHPVVPTVFCIKQTGFVTI